MDVTETVIAYLLGRDAFRIWWESVDDNVKEWTRQDLTEIYQREMNRAAPQTFSCCFCMYEGPDHVINRDDTLMVISGMLVCLEHAPCVPGRLTLSQMIANSIP